MSLSLPTAVNSSAFWSKRHVFHCGLYRSDSPRPPPAQLHTVQMRSSGRFNEATYCSSMGRRTCRLPGSSGSLAEDQEHATEDEDDGSSTKLDDLTPRQYSASRTFGCPKRPRPFGSPPVAVRMTHRHPIGINHGAAAGGQTTCVAGTGHDHDCGCISPDQCHQGPKQKKDDASSAKVPALRAEHRSKRPSHQRTRQGAPATDPLIHSGRWIPTEYVASKKVSRTGCWTCCGNTCSFTTHCRDFDARMQQRQADFNHNVAEALRRSRQSEAAKIRARWTRQEPGDGSVGGRDRGMLGKGKRGRRRRERAKEIASRPFVRQTWLKKFIGAGAASGSSSAKPGVSREGPPSKKQTVRREHVRSVVQLALSDARASAFVAASVLQGLLDVAAVKCSGRSLDSATDGTYVGGYGKSPGHDRVTSVPTAEPLDDSHRNIEHSQGRSSAGTEQVCSGAFFCVEHGALPAILACLNDHAGDPRIEQPGIELLSVVAADDATFTAIAGNLDVVKACTARISPCQSRSACGMDSARYQQSVDEAQPKQLMLDSLNGAAVMSDAAISNRAPQAASDSGSRTVDHTATDAGGAATSTGSSTSCLSSPNVSTRLVHDPCGGYENLPSVQPGREAPGVPAEEHSHVTEDGVRSSQAPIVGITRTETDRRDANARARSASGRARDPAPELVYVLSVALKGSPRCQEYVLQDGATAAMLVTVKRADAAAGPEGARLAEYTLRVLEHLARRQRGRRRLVRDGCIEDVISIVAGFQCHHKVLGAAMALLLLLSNIPEGRCRIVQANGVSVAYTAMKTLVGNASIQIKGVEMLQRLVDEEPKVRLQLDGMKGAWQWLCQGTQEGEALQRYAGGERHVAGWTVTEEENLAAHEALATADVAKTKWTPYRLATFMGTTRDHLKLQISNLAYINYFQVVSEADLLPHAHEGLEAWRVRMRRYEEQRGIRINNITRRRLARDRSGAHAASLSSASSI